MADLDQVLTVEQSKALAAALFNAVTKHLLHYECAHCQRDARKVVSAVERELMAIVDARREAGSAHRR